MTTEPTLEVERSLAPAGSLVIGVDEVGRGAIAGPVAVGVCAADPWAVEVPAGLRDSKLLSAKRRVGLQPVLREWGAARAVGLASAAEVDEHGIVAALGLAGRRALLELHASGVAVLDAVLLLDGDRDWLSPALRRAPRLVTRVKADRDAAVVAAASVLAKVHRDELMQAEDAVHPGYGWASNKGYGSAAHFEALRRLGTTEHHRRTWLA